MSKTIQIGEAVILKKSINKVFLLSIDERSKDKITNTFCGLEHEVVVDSGRPEIALKYATRARAVTAMKKICNKLGWKYHENN